MEISFDHSREVDYTDYSLLSITLRVDVMLSE